MLRSCLFFLIVWTVPFVAAQTPYAPLDGPLVLTEDFKMTGADADSIASVGWSVGTAGTGTNAFIVAGAFRDGTFGPETGAAYVFRYYGLGWLEEQKLLASDAQANDSFGQKAAAYSAEGVSRIAVSAPKWPSFGNIGAVYVFEFNQSLGIWEEEARVTVPDGEEGDGFGSSMAIDATLLLGTTSREIVAGEVHVFVRQEEIPSLVTWTEEAVLIASDAIPNGGFGRGIDLSLGQTDTLAVIGSNNNVTPGGAAYVFRREPDMQGGHTWVEEAKLTAIDGENADNLGWAVSMAETSHGTFALIGAPGDNEPEINRGSAYIFRRQPDGQGGYEWVEEAKLVASDGAVADALGWACDIVDTADGVVAVVSARGFNSFQGAAYTFRRQIDGTWTEVAKLVASDGDFGDFLGRSLSMSGSWVALGAPLDDPMGGPAGRGAVYVFETGRVSVSTEGPPLTTDENSIRLSPNPVTRSWGTVKVQFRMSGQGRVRGAVYDVLGRRLLNFAEDKPAGENSINIDLAGFPLGRYAVKLSDTSGSWTALFTIVE